MIQDAMNKYLLNEGYQTERDKSLIEADTETVSVPATNITVPITVTFKKVSPTNRVRNIILTFLKNIWQTSEQL